MVQKMVSFTGTPPRAPALYKPRIPTRWQKEKEAAGGRGLDFPDDPKFIGPWVIGECVGKGASGHVKVARHRRTGEYAAVKILPLQPIFDSRNSLATQQAKSEKQRLGIDREITMMRLMNHPNIMRIYDVYEGEKELYLILEYVKGGELFDFLVNRGRLGPLEALSFFKQIIYGLNYAHSFSIIHRDLKPENILIKSLNPPVLKIADWGMAAFAPPAWQLETSCGSPHYASPEIVRGLKYQGTATDIWSCGVILFALLTGTLPFDDKDVKILLGKVKLGKFEIPPSVDRVARDLITRMLVVDVKQRITMAEILEHPWMKTDTPRVFYVPAPSVEELARPVQSQAHIDRDIFESLCVIWGRHADPNGIRGDLLSPPGQGTLAKAFYFLLHKHKEKALSDHGIVMDLDEEAVGDKVVHKHYLAPRPRESWKIDLDTPLATPRAVANDRRVLMLDIPLTETSPQSRIRTPSPIGPRAQKPRPSSTPPSPNKTPRQVVTRASSVTSNGRDHPPLRERRLAQLGRRASVRAAAGSTITSPGVFPMSRASTEPASDIYTPPPMVRTSQQMYGVRRTMAQGTKSTSSRVPIVTRAMTAPERSQSVEPTTTSYTSTPIQETYPTSTTAAGTASSVVHAPALVRPTPLPMLPMISAPRVASAEIQKTIDDIADRMNLLVAHENAHYAQQIQLRRQSHQHRQVQSQLVQYQQQSSDASSSSNPYSPHLDGGEGGDATDGEMTPRFVERDKENQSYGSWLQIHRPSSQATVPLRDAANTTYQRQPLGEANRGTEKERDKDKGRRSRKLRPPALDLRNASHRQSIASPLLSPPLSTAGSEFKGWFTNLFNWKGQSYTLYSFQDVATTREEMTRALARAGVVVLTSETNLVKCRVDEVCDEITGAIVQKQVRFRAEFGPCTTQTYPNAHSGGGDALAVPHTPRLLTPRLMSTPMSPIPSSSGYASMVTLVLERGAVSTFKAMYLRVRELWVLDSQESILGEEFDEGGSTPRPRSVIAHL